MKKTFTGFDSVLGESKQVHLSLVARGLEVKYIALDMSFFVAYSAIAEFTCHFAGDSHPNHRIQIVARSGSIVCDVIFPLPDPDDAVNQIKTILEQRIG